MQYSRAVIELALFSGLFLPSSYHDEVPKPLFKETEPRIQNEASAATRHERLKRKKKVHAPYTRLELTFQTI